MDLPLERYRMAKVHENSRYLDIAVNEIDVDEEQLRVNINWLAGRAQSREDRG